MPFMYGITDQNVAGGTAITIVNRDVNEHLPHVQGQYTVHNFLMENLMNKLPGWFS